MDLGLTNSVAIVTGGSSGIGFATARLLLVEGARVAICGRNPQRLATAKAQLDAVKPGAVLAETCDVLDADAVNGFARKVAEWGGGIDLLINNAGQSRVSSFADLVLRAISCQSVSRKCPGDGRRPPWTPMQGYGQQCCMFNTLA